MKKPAPQKKPNPIAKGLSEFKPQVVKDKKAYIRKPKHPKKQKDGE
ncbi:MAG: hypothetical protein V3R64_02790 [Sphingomonadales bacterium]